MKQMRKGLMETLVYNIDGQMFNHPIVNDKAFVYVQVTL